MTEPPSYYGREHKLKSIDNLLTTEALTAGRQASLRGLRFPLSSWAAARAWLEGGQRQQGGHYEFRVLHGLKETGVKQPSKQVPAPLTTGRPGSS